MPQAVGCIRRVAGEDLVGAVPGKAHADVLAGETREQIHGHDRRVRERLVHLADDLGQRLRDVGVDTAVGVVGLEMAGGLPSLRHLVVCLLGEAQRERPIAAGRAEARDRAHDGAGVHSAAQEGAERHVAHEPQAHRVLEEGV